MAVYASDPAAGMPSLKVSLERALEAVLFLIEEAAARGVALTQYEIVKSIFLADTDHLNKYGRPVTFDNYVAMKYGPVPTATYDMLKPSFNWRAAFDLNAPPWRTRPSSRSDKATEFVNPTRSANRRILSKTDQSSLVEALEVVRSLQFGGVVDLTHKHPAYTAVWREGSNSSYPMDYAKLLECPDPALIEDLADASRHIR